MNTSPRVHDIPALFHQDLIGLEKILWTGRPGRKAWIGWDLMAVPFGLLILGFGIAFILGTSGLISPEHKLSWTALFGLAAILPLRIGFFFAVDPFVDRIWKIPNTFYAVTDQRILILCTVPKRSLHSLSIKDISDSKNVMSPDGRGTIAFVGDLSKRGKKAMEDILPYFTNIDDVRSVDELISNLRKHI